MRTGKILLERTMYWLALLSLVWFAVELISLSGLKLLDSIKDTRYEPVRFEFTDRNRDNIRGFIDGRVGHRILSPTLGWTNEPGARRRLEGRKDASPFTININTQGLRGRKTYPLVPEEDRVRILAFGDSFTFGTEVNAEDSWTENLSTFAPQVEVLNFGVPAFGLDQALLRYEEEGRQFNPHIVLMGFVTENIKRHVNVYRPFLYRGSLPAAKPRFLLSGESLKLLPNPLPTPEHYEDLLENESKVIATLGAHDYYYRMDCRPGRFDLLPSVRLGKILRWNLRENPGADAVLLDNQYNTESEAFQVTVRIFERFSRAVIEDGAKPVAVIFPHGDDIKRFRQAQDKSYLPLLEHLEHHGIDYVDLMDAFQRAGRTHPPHDFLGRSGYYSPLANMVVAHHLWKYLESRELLN